MRTRLVFLMLTTLLAAGGCASASDAAATASTPASMAAFTETGVPSPPGPLLEAFALWAPEIPADGVMPARYTCDGENLSPALAWSGQPAETRSLVVNMEDPDAKGFVHWLVYAIPASFRGLPEGIPGEGEVEGGLRQGVNSFGQIGYGGPCPPGATHRYVFRLLALDAVLDSPSGLGADDLRRELAPHQLAEAVLTLSYTRP
jgi:Raf kinase inhibitor-like YbhB/YbcL family protein